jgi:uncharacterized protein YciI
VKNVGFSFLKPTYEDSRAQERSSMFIVILTYVKPIEEVDACLAAHIEYLDEQFAAGCFIAAGRRVPRTGGVILCRASNREALEIVLDRDPFILNDVAKYEIIEFAPTRTATEFAALMGS